MCRSSQPDRHMNTEASENDETGARGVRKLQLVRVGATQFGIFAEEVSAIVAWQEPTPLPHAPDSVLGVVSIQGRMLTVLDLSMLPVGEGTLSDSPRNAGAHLIALRGDEQLALAVAAVGEIIARAPNDSMTDFVAKSDTVTPLLGVLRREGAEIKILNVKGLFPAVIQGRERRQRRF